MDMITRTLSISTIVYSEAVEKDGEPVFEKRPDEIVSGTYTKEKALALLRKKYGADNMYYISDVFVESTRYGMSVDEFIEHAHVMPNKKAEPNTAANECSGEGAPETSNGANVSGEDSIHADDGADSGSIPY